ncbi:MAG TPA: class D sortase [Clostridia bacterium]|nr:class D sortase [Clostridia bacterium]
MIIYESERILNEMPLPPSLGYTDDSRLNRTSLAVRLFLFSIPYLLFMVGLILISIGFFRYVENESMLALFLTDRGRNTAIHLESSSWSDELPTPAAIPTQLPAITEVPHEKPETVHDSADDRPIIPFFYVGDKIGVLSIPAADILVDVFQGDRENELRLGAGHYTGSYLPGQGNNILIAGHRTTYFRNFEYVEVGDEITFTTTYGAYDYYVKEIKIIEGSDNSVARETESEQLTLYTCYPFIYFGNAPNRYVLICIPSGEQVNK